MRLFPLCCALLLSGCSGRDREPVTGSPPVPADLLMPCPGYTGPVPANEGQLSDALVAEARGRACANGRLEAVAGMLNAPVPK